MEEVLNVWKKLLCSVRCGEFSERTKRSHFHGQRHQARRSSVCWSLVQTIRISGVPSCALSCPSPMALRLQIFELALIISFDGAVILTAPWTPVVLPSPQSRAALGTCYVRRNFLTSCTNLLELTVTVFFTVWYHEEADSDLRRQHKCYWRYCQNTISAASIEQICNNRQVTLCAEKRNLNADSRGSDIKLHFRICILVINLSR